MTLLRQLSVLLLVVSLLASVARAQSRKTTSVTLPGNTTLTVPGSSSATARTAPKPYKDVITAKARTSRGLMTTHFLDEKWYFEIPDSLLGREIMAVTRYSKTAAGGGIFGGEEVNRQVVRWERGPENKLFLRSVTYTAVSADSTKPMFQSVKNSSAEPIVGAFDVKAYRKDSATSATVIEVTDFFKADNQVVSLDNLIKQRFKLTTLLADRSYIQLMRSYPINTEIRTVKTFGVVPPTITLPSPVPVPQIGQYLPAGRDAGVVTMEFNTSMILLPKVPMRKRLFDSRVGYFANQYISFGEESQNSEEEVFAVRWRLEPKNAADAAR